MGIDCREEDNFNEVAPCELNDDDLAGLTIEDEL